MVIIYIIFSILSFAPVEGALGGASGARVSPERHPKHAQPYRAVRLEWYLRRAAPPWQPSFWVVPTAMELSQTITCRDHRRLATVDLAVRRMLPFKSGRALPWSRPIDVLVIKFSFVAFGSL